MNFGMVSIDPAPPPAPSQLPGGSEDPTAPKLPGERPDLDSGISGSTSGTGEASTTSDPYADERSEYEELIAQAKADEDAALQGIDADIARAQRRQAEMNARMGGAVGGGLQGGMATTATLGARERAEAQVSAREKTRNLQMSWLDKQLELKERDMSRKFGREMSDRDKAHQIQLEAVRLGIDLPPEFQEALDAGEYGTALESYGGGGEGGEAGEVGPAGEGTYSGGVFGDEGYTNADRSTRMDPRGHQYWRFGDGGYEVSGQRAGFVVQGLLSELNLDVDALDGIITGVSQSQMPAGPFDVPSLQFGGSPAALEVQAWFSKYLEDNDGEYPGPFELRDKLKEMEVL